jgi:hypothetical protein
MKNKFKSILNDKNYKFKIQYLSQGITKPPSRKTTYQGLSSCIKSLPQIFLKINLIF